MQEKRHTSAIVSELMPCSKRFSSIGTVLVVLVAERDELSYWYKQIGVCINAYICHYTKIKYKTLAKNIWSYPVSDAVAELVERNLRLERRLFVAWIQAL